MPRNDNMTFLHDDNDSLISVFKVKDVSYPKVFHIGFLQDTPEQVRALYAATHGGRLQHSRLPMKTTDG